jgi:hypothetical protein
MRAKAMRVSNLDETVEDLVRVRGARRKMLRQNAACQCDGPFKTFCRAAGLQASGQDGD